MKFTVREHMPGLQGLRDGLATAAQFVIEGMRDPRIFTWARRAIRDAGLPVNAMPSAQVAAIYAAQRRDMAFVQDPYATELMQSAIVSLCLDPAGECSPGGDCDDNIIVTAAVMMSIGIPVRFLLRSYPRLNQLHLMLQYDADPYKGGQWTCFDATSPNGACFAGYDSEAVVDLEVGPMAERTPGQLLALGQPPPTTPSSSTPTTPAAQPAPLSPAQQSAWIVLLAQAKDRVDGSAAELRSSSQVLDAVRADLGMPAVDPTPATGEAAGVSPLAEYGQTFAWTAAAQNAQAKLLQTADFCSGVLGDALAGRRLLYWQEGDLYVGALSGDAYGVLMKPAPGSSTPVPTYIDLSSGATNGRIGFCVAPILVGIAIVSLSLAAAYAVSKLCDYLSSAHRDDAVQKVADAQQALVASGAQTPEQAQAFMRAAADLASAPPPGAASKGPSWTDLLAAGAVGLAVGVVAVVVGNRVLSGLRLMPAAA